MTGGLSFDQILTIAEADHRNAGEIDRQAGAARTLADRLVSVRERLHGNDTGVGDDVGGFFADALSGTVDGLVAHLDDSARVIRPQADALHEVASTARSTREALRRLESERDAGDRGAEDEARSVLAKAGASYWGAVARLEPPNSYDGPREREPDGGGEFRQSDAGGGPGGRSTAGIPLPGTGTAGSPGGPASGGPALQSGGPAPVTAPATGPAPGGAAPPGPGPAVPFTPGYGPGAPPASPPARPPGAPVRATGTPNPFGTRTAGTPNPFGTRTAGGPNQVPARALPRPPGPTTAPVIGRRGTQPSTRGGRGTDPRVARGPAPTAGGGRGGTAPRAGTRSLPGAGGSRSPVEGGRGAGPSPAEPRSARGASSATEGRAVRSSTVGGRGGTAPATDPRAPRSVSPSVIGRRAGRGAGVRVPARFGDGAVNRAVIAGARPRPDAVPKPPAAATKPRRHDRASAAGERDHLWAVDAATVPAVIGGRRAAPSTMAFDPGEYLTRHNLGQSRVTAWGEPAEPGRDARP